MTGIYSLLLANASLSVSLLQLTELNLHRAHSMVPHLWTSILHQYGRMYKYPRETMEFYLDPLFWKVHLGNSRHELRFWQDFSCRWMAWWSSIWIRTQAPYSQWRAYSWSQGNFLPALHSRVGQFLRLISWTFWHWILQGQGGKKLSQSCTQSALSWLAGTSGSVSHYLS